jgi:hypothetical protein
MQDKLKMDEGVIKSMLKMEDRFIDRLKLTRKDTPGY